MAARTHGEVYETSPGYRAKIARMADETRPAHDAVASLKSAGMTGEDAWAKVIAAMVPPSPTDADGDERWPYTEDDVADLTGTSSS